MASLRLLTAVSTQGT